MKQRLRMFAAVAAALALTACSSAGSGDGSETYTVTYHANDADGGTPPNDATRYEAGAVVTVLDNTGSLTRDGYPFFIGWSSEADGGGEEYLIGDTFEMPAGDMTLYALWRREELLFVSQGGTGDFFGGSVGVDGDYAIVGASQQDFARDGFVYIYRHTGDNEWDPGFRITPAANGTLFGRATAIAGDDALIGAVDAANFNGGAVHAYRRTGLNTWAPAGTLSIPNDTTSSRSFGAAIAMDGSYAVVGDEKDSEAGSDAGAAHVFRRNDSGVWDHVQKLVRADDGFPKANERFGASVAIDGDHLIVGAVGGFEAAYIFRRTDDDEWIQVERLSEPGLSIVPENNQFGASVAIDGDYTVVGAPRTDFENSPGGSTFVDIGAAYLYRRTAVDTWSRVTSNSGRRSFDFFGHSVAIAGSTTFVGAREYEDEDGTTDTGAIFVLPLGDYDFWEAATVLVPDNATSSALFGSAVAVGEQHLVVGATGSNSTHIWRYR